MSTGYVVKFTLIMTILAALILSVLFYATEPIAKKNEAVFNKRAILSAVGNYLETPLNEMDDETVLKVFDEQIDQVALTTSGEIIEGVKADEIDLGKERKKDIGDRQLPFFKYKSAGKTYFIMSVRGKGLWDEIWGNIAVESDLNTIAGASFDHRGETPGLGAEIKDAAAFPAAFIGKTIYNENGVYDPVDVAKGEAKPGTNYVDGISGATITGDGVGDMIEVWLKLYEPYINKLKSDGKLGMN